jgi:hypothetical protein
VEGHAGRYICEKMAGMILPLLKKYHQVLSFKLNIGSDITWGIFNSAIRPVMVNFKEGREGSA